MATLKRSEISFRRQGSSGLAWRESWIPGTGGGEGGASPPNKDEQQREQQQQILRHSKSVGLAGAGYSRSGHNHGRHHRIRSSENIEARGGGGLGLPSPLDKNGGDAGKAEFVTTSHKSGSSRLVRWIKRTLSRFKR